MKPFFVAWMLIFSASVVGQKIDKSKRELNSSSGQSRGQTSQSSSSSYSGSDSSDNPLAQIFFDVTIGAVYYGVIGSYAKENHLNNNLTPYPFYDGRAGNYKSPDSISTTGFRVDADARFLYGDNKLFGGHLKAKVRPFEYLYAQVDYRSLVENTIDGRRDRLSLLHFSIAYDRLRMERVNLGWTVGASYVGSDVNKLGFAYGVSAEYFISNRYSLDASAKWSWIKGHPVHAYEFSGRMHKKNLFLSLGYQHLKIASPTYNFITAGVGIYLF